MQALIGDYAFYIIGALLIIASIGWLRRPLWRVFKAGVASIFTSGGSSEPEPEPKKRTARTNTGS